MQHHPFNPMNQLTNILTIIVGSLTMTFAAIAKPLGILLMLPWFPYLIGCLGGLASLVATCKALHEWRMNVRRDRMDSEVHRTRMDILTGKKEGTDGH